MKFKSFHFILLLVLMYGCKIFHHPPEANGFNIEPGTKSFVVIDGGIAYTPGLVLKKRRQGVIREVKNLYLVILSSVLQKQLRLNSVTDTTLTAEERNKLAKKDPVIIASLSKKYNNAIVLILRDCFSGFSESDSKKVLGPDGQSTTKLVKYAVFFDTDWIIVQGNSMNEKTVSASKLLSDIYAGKDFLGRGPAYQANKSEIQDVAEKNAFNVAQLFKY